jgi:hypothetical protein
MPIELSNTLKDTCGWSFASPGINNIFCNKVYTAGVLTVIIIILVMIIYPGKAGTPMWVIFKLGFYILLATVGVIFIHDSIVHNISEKKIEGGASDAFINALDGSENVAFAGDRMAIEHRSPITGGDGITGDNTCCIIGGDKKSNEEIFSMFGV